MRWKIPAFAGSGAGYFDHNNGDEPLEAGFRNWDWSRAHAGGDTLIHYDARTRDGSDCELALRLKAGGDVGDARRATLAGAATHRYLAGGAKRAQQFSRAAAGRQDARRHAVLRALHYPRRP